MKKQIFSINEESIDGGVSFCWVEKKKGKYFLYGSELDLISSGPRDTVCDAVTDYQYGMEHVEIECSVTPQELATIVASGAFDWESISAFSINGVDISSREPTSISAEYGRKTKQ